MWSVLALACYSLSMHFWASLEIVTGWQVFCTVWGPSSAFCGSTPSAGNVPTLDKQSKPLGYSWSISSLLSGWWRKSKIRKFMLPYFFGFLTSLELINNSRSGQSFGFSLSSLHHTKLKATVRYIHYSEGEEEGNAIPTEPRASEKSGRKFVRSWSNLHGWLLNEVNFLS